MESPLDDRLLAFIAVSIAVVVIPGPDMALVARNVLRHGRSAGFATSVGICTGVLGWAVAAALGVATLLAASATALTVLKLAGAAYLIYLGITTLRGDDAPAVAGASDGSRLPWHRAWLQGLLSAMLNPKLGVFFLTLLPQFISPGDPPAARALQLAAVFEVIAPDPEGIITGGHDNKTGRAVAPRQDEPINERALSAMFREIIANNRAGGWRKLQAKGASSAD